MSALNTAYRWQSKAEVSKLQLKGYIQLTASIYK